MKTRACWLTFLATMMVTAIIGCATDGNNNGMDDDDEAEVAMRLADMPAPVRTAILNTTPESNITQLTSEMEDGRRVYEVEYTVNGQDREAEFDAQGNVLAEDDDDDDDD